MHCLLLFGGKPCGKISSRSTLFPFIHSDKGLKLETWVFVRWLIYFIDLVVDNLFYFFPGPGSH